jgi:uncharacterized protein (DUF2235 family)
MSALSPSVTLNAVPREGRNLVLCFDGTDNQYNGAVRTL